MIEPFFYNNDKNFALYHPPSSAGSTRLLVVCPPLFDDYRRSYRALSELAIACAAKGIHVLRFDYFGTGEAPGLLEEASIQNWIQNIEATINEGIELTGSSDVVLSGIRFGATLASQVKHSSVLRYVYLDPLLSGHDYLNELNAYNKILGDRHLMLARYANKKFTREDCVNFSLSELLINELEQISLKHSESEKKSVCTISTDPNAEKKGLPGDVEFGNVIYDWPPYHDGVISLKPALEALTKRIIS